MASDVPHGRFARHLQDNRTIQFASLGTTQTNLLPDAQPLTQSSSHQVPHNRNSTQTTTTRHTNHHHQHERTNNQPAVQDLEQEEDELEDDNSTHPSSGLARRQAPPASSTEASAFSQQAAAAAAAYALAQEDRKAADKLNAELCRNFSVGLQHETGGIFTSPHYPNPYPANLICTKLIEAPSGYFVVLEFRDQFNIEEAGNDCDNDKIEIRDGRFGYSKVLARYCGQRFPPEVRSSDEAMWLRFISDGSITHTGFKAVYRFERQKNTKPLPPFECRFNVTTMVTLANAAANAANAALAANMNASAPDNKTGIHSGIIRNTDVPQELIDYSKQWNVSLECIWNITVTPGWKIYLTFSSYEINRPNDCDSNFIEIYEENLTEENQTVKFCGTRTEPQQSRSNVFNIRHHAVPAASGSRFEIIYTAFREKGPAGCDSREFDCDDGTCIHESLKCDGTVNCKYRYDEAAEPGPCAIGEDVQPFFETEHMVIILIVFLTLVSGMCASIIISCWGKIQERRRRKLEYHMRKSREASMEGQMNKVDQLYTESSTNGSRANLNNGGGAAGASKLRLAAPIAPSDDLNITQQQQQFNQLNNAYGQRLVQLEADQQQQLLYQQSQNKLLAAQQAALYSSKQQLQAAANNEAALLNTLVRNQQHQQQKQQQYLASAMCTQQTDSQDSSSQAVGSLLLNNGGGGQQLAGNSATMPKLFGASKPQVSSLEQQQQQMLFDSQQNQRRRQFIQNQNSIYGTQQQQQRALTLSAMHAADLGGGGWPQSTSRGQAQLVRQPMTLNGQPQFYGQQQPLGQQAHLSSSITCCNSLAGDYGGASAETPLINELIKRANAQKTRALLANQRNQLAAQHLQQQQQQQLRQLDTSASIPRSVSAYQLSKAQLRHNQQLIQQQQQQQVAATATRPHPQQQQQQQQFQMSYKSMSDAGHASKHQPPNHSLSYPHACTGDHAESPALPPPPPPPNMNALAAITAAQSRSNSTLPASAGAQDNKRAAFKISRLEASQLTGDTLPESEFLPAAALGSMQSDELSTESDATFGLLVDSAGNASFGPAPQSVGGAQPALGAAHSQQLAINQQRLQSAAAINQQLMAAAAANQAYKPASSLLAGLPPPPPQSLIVAHQQQQQQQFNQLQQANYVAHLGECNLVRRHQQQQQQRANSRQQMLLLGQSSQSSGQPAPVCDCGALERAAQLRQRLVLQQNQQVGVARPQIGSAAATLNQNQQRQALLLQSSDTRDFDLEDSEEAKAMPYGFTSDLQQQQPMSQVNRFSHFRQQSSELTAEDEDDDEEEDDENEEEEDGGADGLDDELDEDEGEGRALRRRRPLMGNNIGRGLSNNLDSNNESYELDESCELPHTNKQARSNLVAVKQQYGANSTLGGGGATLVRRHNEVEPLRDAASKQQRHLSDSRASLSQHSCTCGSQSKLNQINRGDDDDEDESATVDDESHKHPPPPPPLVAQTINGSSGPDSSTALAKSGASSVSRTQSERAASLLEKETCDNTDTNANSNNSNANTNTK